MLFVSSSITLAGCNTSVRVFGGWVLDGAIPVRWPALFPSDKGMVSPRCENLLYFTRSKACV